MQGMIKVQKEKIEQWLKCREWTQTQLAEALNYDEGNLSRIIKGEIEPSKQLMKKLMVITGLDLVMFVFDRNSVSEEKD